ncbi:hypothetical protein GCWU000324_00932 [Kingella oralis ATCC 51147]|uniref:Uncharacterized protein n=1 Tax=Kingella oralis ATCC 51147 TaxID=629741 RepID=C4GFL7_9NEIS|nr:hypothetical protein GCWU000324_00932 [Kingella oralis ATCC 51147]
MVGKVCAGAAKGSLKRLNVRFRLPFICGLIAPRTGHADVRVAAALGSALLVAEALLGAVVALELARSLPHLFAVALHALFQGLPVFHALMMLLHALFSLAVHIGVFAAHFACGITGVEACVAQAFAYRAA